MKKFFIYLFFSIFVINAIAQIYEPEGLNMPGSWDSWSNPPTNKIFASASQVQGGEVKLITGLAKKHYQTAFSTPDSLKADDYEFLFTSGPSSDYYKNKWGNVSAVFNSIQTYKYASDAANNSVSLNNNKFYIVNFEDNGYSDTRAIFMELSSKPAKIISLSTNPLLPDSTENDTIKIQTNIIPPSEQHFYIRYTTDHWTSSQVKEFSFVDKNAKVVLPKFAANTKVEYYIFSSTIHNPSSDFDLITINFDNNYTKNYSYVVPGKLSCAGEQGVIVTSPVFPLENGSITITFDASKGNEALENYNDSVYAHIGLITSSSSDDNDWKYVKTDWGENSPDTKFTKIGNNLYQLKISNIRNYFGVPENEKIYKIALVIRSAKPVSSDAPNNFYVARNADGSDFKINVYDAGLAVKIINPDKKKPLVPVLSIVPVCAYAMGQTDFELFVDDKKVFSTSKDTIIYGLKTYNYSTGYHTIVAMATDNSDTVTDTTYFFIRPKVIVQDMPQGLKNGINYIDKNTVTLVLWEPADTKNYVFVIGDFNNWKIDQNYYMKRTPDGKHYWLTISGLSPGKEYAFQYFIDGQLKIADPYADKILDPWNDKYIPEYNYPNLMKYPLGKTKGIVSVLQTMQTPYQWQVKSFTPSAINGTQSNLIVYELLIRDFVKSSAIKDVEKKLDYLDSLGINAIELMPFNEFEGNISWGYNPDFYFAPDKYYGTKNDYKHFIDECHKRGIAVIMDIVLNHSFGLSPMVQMYWDSKNNRPAANNPWYNQVAPHPLSPGYDFNHESPYTKEFVKNVLKYWLSQYKIDGFRFDLAKGFTQKYTGNDINAWSQYDQSRVDIWKDYYSYIKSVKPDAYVILEELASNDEEKVLANEGMLLWGNMNKQFSQAAMGYQSNSDFSWAYYANRSYTYPNLIPYMESHDEERIMYNTITFGNSSASFSYKNLDTALKSDAKTAAFYFAIPGPKMIWQFGELGYDYSINTCQNGELNDNCRTSPKPVHWDYWQQKNRRKLYFTYLNLMHLKTSQKAFLSGSFTYDLSGTGKREWISSDDFNLVLAGNFDVAGFNMTPSFQHTGIWYDFFNQDTIHVNKINKNMFFKPGEFHLFTDVYVPFVVDNQTNIAEKNHSSNSNIKLFPIPANKFLTIAADDLYKIEILDISGKILKTLNMSNKQQTLDVSSLPKALYIFRFVNKKNSTAMKVIIK
jgi:1,4-alpha-glucan branching enzyme